MLASGKQLTDASIATSKLADASVTTVKIADANVTTAKIVDANVTNAKLARPFNGLVLSSDFTIAGTSLADVTGMTIALAASSTYIFNFELALAQTSTQAQITVAVNYSGTVTKINYNAYFSYADTDSIIALTAQTKNTSLQEGQPRLQGNTLPIRVTGSIITNGSGTLALRAARSAATSVIVAGSCGFVQQVG
jgi:hypothetical protein